MYVKELRIGNIVNCNGEEIIITDIGSWDGGFGLNMTHTGEYKFVSTEDKIRSIPLSKKRFIKARFKSYKNPNKTNSIIYERDHIRIVYDCELKTYSLRDFNERKVVIKYVHKLQNVYYELEEKELGFVL